MEFKPIYDNTELILIALVCVVVMVIPPTVASLIAKEKGRRFLPFAYFYCSFILLPVIATFIQVSFSGVEMYVVSIIVIPAFVLAPVWHSLRLRMSDKLQQASQEQGVRLKSCLYCDKPFEDSNVICPFCHHRTASSLITDWRVVLFVLSIVTFILAFFMASDEYFHNSRTYNMLASLLHAVELVPYVAVAKSSSLTFILLFQMIVSMGCCLYTIGLILHTASCLTRGKAVQSPLLLFIVALYITVIHPILFLNFTLKSDEAVTLEFSLGWIFWVISYALMCLSLHYLHIGGSLQNDSTTKPRSFS